VSHSGKAQDRWGANSRLEVCEDRLASGLEGQYQYT